MPRKIEDIITQLRAVIANPSIKTCLIQTEDLLALCDEIDMPYSGQTIPQSVEDALKPQPGWKEQPFEYYAAHFLVGAGLTKGNLHGNVGGLTQALKRQYDLGVQHGREYPAEARAL